MKSSRWEAAAALFDLALEQPASERAEFIRAACGADLELLERVRAMLRVDAAASPLLDATPENLAAALAADAATPLTGQRIGPYTLLDILGRGGMGVVYLAQREDVGKQVALKLVAGGLASPDRVARFLQERRVLAQLEHPHIARMLDAGVTEDGTPWLAMEYVPGQPIDVYCQSREISLDQRLALFERVCGAVAYAHRHLVVHRDLKPSNILIGLDGEPRLVDFGIAKLLDASTSDGEPQTVTMLRPMTPQYASPEQIQGGVITTASDVYQLGALLFELLTDRRAHEQRAERSPTHPDAQVPKPSRVADRRRARQLAGDLDNIVRKTTESEPQRRYATAEQLAEDVRRHREGLPVLARPASSAYRFRKFVGRHRVGSAMAAAAVLGLLGFALAMEEQARRVAAQRNRAEQVSQLLVDLLAGADPTVAQGDTITVAAVLDRGTTRVRSDVTLGPEVKGRLLRVIANAYRNLGQMDRSIALLGEGVTTMRSTLPPKDKARLEATKLLASWLALAGAQDSAAALVHEALVAGRALPASRRAELADIVSTDAFVKQMAANAEGARAAYEEALALYRATPDSLSEGFEAALVNLGFLAEARGDRSASENFWREALRRRRARLGSNHSLTAKSMMDLSKVLVETNQLEEAEQLVLEAVAVQRRVYSGPHSEVLGGLIAAARVLGQRGKAAEAETKLREALAMGSELYGADSDALAMTTANLAGYVQQQGRLDEAAEIHRAALRLYTAGAGERYASTAIVLTNLAYNTYLRRRLADADSLYRQALTVLDSAWQGSPQIVQTLLDFSQVLIDRGNCREADAHLRRVIAFDLQDKPPNFAPGTRARRMLGNCLVNLGRLAEAEPLLLDAHRRLLSGWGPSNTFTQGAARELVILYERWGKPAEAQRYRPRSN